MHFRRSSHVHLALLRRHFFAVRGHLRAMRRPMPRRRHHAPLDDRRIADDDLALALGRQHLDRHLAVGLGAAEIDEDRNTFFGPGIVNGFEIFSTLVPRPAVGIAAAETGGTSLPTIWRTMSRCRARHRANARR